MAKGTLTLIQNSLNKDVNVGGMFTYKINKSNNQLTRNQNAKCWQLLIDEDTLD